MLYIYRRLSLLFAWQIKCQQLQSQGVTNCLTWDTNTVRITGFAGCDHPFRFPHCPALGPFIAHQGRPCLPESLESLSFGMLTTCTDIRLLTMNPTAQLSGRCMVHVLLTHQKIKISHAFIKVDSLHEHRASGSPSQWPLSCTQPDPCQGGLQKAFRFLMHLR